MRLEDNVVLGIYNLRGGRIFRMRQFVDESAALDDLGLSEPRIPG